jgi:MFS family permease
LIADITPAASRGAAFGLRQALDTVGAVAGPLLAIAAMLLLAGDFRAVFWLAAVPAFAAVVLLIVGVREPAAPGATHENEPRVALSDIGQLSSEYWWIVGIAAVMTLARFSEAFLVLRAQSIGMTMAWIPLVMAIMSIVYAAVAYPAGVLADRGRQSALLQGGLLALIIADLVLANAGSTTIVFAGTAIWGIHMGLTQGVLSALVAANAPAGLRGTAFGLFNLVSGIALLMASALAGWLWDAFGPALTFYAGAVFTALSWLALALRRPFAIHPS